MALCGPGTPRNLRPTARARGLPDGGVRCGSWWLLTRASVTGGARGAPRGRHWVAVIKYDTCARTLYAISVPPRGAAVNGRLRCGLRGYGAAGSASAWHAEGPGFDSP